MPQIQLLDGKKISFTKSITGTELIVDGGLRAKP